MEQKEQQSIDNNKKFSLFFFLRKKILYFSSLFDSLYAYTFLLISPGLSVRVDCGLDYELLFEY